MGLQAVWDDPFLRAMHRKVMQRSDCVTGAAVAKRQGNEQQANAYGAMVAELDHLLATVGCLGRRDPKGTCERFLLYRGFGVGQGFSDEDADEFGLLSILKSQPGVEFLASNPETLDFELVLSGLTPLHEGLSANAPDAPPEPPFELETDSGSEAAQFKTETPQSPTLAEQVQKSTAGIGVGRTNGQRNELPDACTNSDAVLTNGADAPPPADQAAIVETASARRNREAADDMRYRLGVANHVLREKRKTGEKQRVTVAALADQMALTPSYLGSRAKELRIDLGPFKLLTGPRIFDPLRVIEKT